MNSSPATQFSVATRRFANPGLLASCAAIAVLPAIALTAQAQQAAAPQPLWEFGGVGLAISQQAYPGSAKRTNRALALPYLLYRGDFFRADRDNVGFRAFKSPTLELDVGFAGALGASSGELDARRGMPDLGTLVEFGPRLKWNLGEGAAGGRLRAEFTLRGVFDLSDGLSSKGVSFEPKLVYENSLGDWRYSTSIAAVNGNRRLTDTFYGVASSYATAGRPAYNAQGGLMALRLGATASRALTPDLRLLAFVRVDSLAGSANRASPLVEKNSGTTVGLTLLYTWARSQTMVSD